MREGANDAHRPRRTRIHAKRTELLEQAVRAPWNEVKPIGFGIQLNKKVVAIAGVAVPETQQPFHCPESKERLLIDV